MAIVSPVGTSFYSRHVFSLFKLALRSATRGGRHVRRAAPARIENCSLIGQHAPQFGLVCLVGDYSVTEFALAGTRFRRQNMACECVSPGDFTCTRFLETLRGTLMCLHLGHNVSPGNWVLANDAEEPRKPVKPGIGSGTTLSSITRRSLGHATALSLLSY